jgi:ribosome maturation factor RimP
LANNEDLKDLIQDSTEPIVKGMGFDIVELRVNKGKKLIDIELIITKQDGIGIDDCAEISRNIYPRLELIPQCEGFVLKVSSPGVDRLLKSIAEYEIFKGRGVKLLFPEASEWEQGIIGETRKDGFMFLQGSESKFIEFAAIKKARLADVQGGLK